MEIILGKMAGFCGGVKKAIDKTYKEAENSKEEIYCLGDLVHNPVVLKKLEKMGVKIINSLNEVPNPDGKTVIIRAHGVTKDIYEQANKMGIKIKDLTCPKVLKIHEKAEEYKQNGYYLFLIGAKKHPEVIGTFGFCGENACMIESMEDIPISLQKFQESNKKKIAIISQTTFSLKKFQEFTEKIKENLKEIEILIDNTICNATSTRQKETGELAKNVDAMTIIGGKNSSNTKKLYELAKEENANTQIVETVAEIELDKIKGRKKIGIMAGASTPNESIEEVVRKLEKINVEE